MLATPAWGRHSLDPVRSNGAVTGVWWGETLFGRDALADQPPVPDRLRALAGVYLNRDPWTRYAVVLARGGHLVLEGGGPLVDHGDWWSPEKDIGGVERLRFDGMLNGLATRLNVSGTDFLRLRI